MQALFTITLQPRLDPLAERFPVHALARQAGLRGLERGTCFSSLAGIPKRRDRFCLLLN